MRVYRVEYTEITLPSDVEEQFKGADITEFPGNCTDDAGYITLDDREELLNCLEGSFDNVSAIRGWLDQFTYPVTLQFED